FCANLNWLSTNGADWPRWKALLETVHELREVYEGDFYPLTPWSLSDGDLAAWMYHRPETGKAVVQVFRRSQASMPKGYKVRLKKLDPKADYEVRNVDDSKPASMTGAALMEDGLPVDLSQQPQSALFILQKKGS
ncbi:MAG: GH36 C-terminal domain-containing protein, partial [Verrucomicrobiota bacterium]